MNTIPTRTARWVLCCLLSFPSAGPAEDSERKRITLHELNSKFDLIGRLGQPVFSVIRIKGVLFDGEETRLKAKMGKVLLKVTEVEGKALKAPTLMDFGVFQRGSVKVNGVDLDKLDHKNKGSVFGKEIECVGYELISGRGVPARAFDHVASIATTGPHFSSEFVILKVLP